MFSMLTALKLHTACCTTLQLTFADFILMRNYDNHLLDAALHDAACHRSTGQHFPASPPLIAWIVALAKLRMLGRATAMNVSSCVTDSTAPSLSLSTVACISNIHLLENGSDLLCDETSEDCSLGPGVLSVRQTAILTPMTKVRYFVRVSIYLLSCLLETCLHLISFLPFTRYPIIIIIQHAFSHTESGNPCINLSRLYFIICRTSEIIKMSASSEQQIRVLPQVVDEVAASRPDTTWVHYPRSNDVKDGYRDITFKELQQATDRMAHWIERNVGTSTTRETFAYMGVNDIRYIFTILAATKTGYKVLLPSVRNSEEAQRSLLRNTKCTTFLHSAETKAQVKAFDDPELSLKSFEIPTLNELLDQDATSESYKGKISHDPNEIMIIIHTSGSTGLPKPIPLRNGYLATVYGLRDIQVEGRTTVSNVIFNDQPLYCR